MSSSCLKQPHGWQRSQVRFQNLTRKFTYVNGGKKVIRGSNRVELTRISAKRRLWRGWPRWWKGRPSLWGGTSEAYLRAADRTQRSRRISRPARRRGTSAMKMSRVRRVCFLCESRSLSSFFVWSPASCSIVSHRWIGWLNRSTRRKRKHRRRPSGKCTLPTARYSRADLSCKWQVERWEAPPASSRKGTV